MTDRQPNGVFDAQKAFVIDDTVRDEARNRMLTEITETFAGKPPTDQLMRVMNQRIDTDKLNLTATELGMLKDFQSFVLSGDAAGFDASLKSLDPRAAGKVLSVLEKDLNSIGIPAHAYFKSKLDGPGAATYLRGHEDIALLDIAPDRSATMFSKVTFSTEGQLSAVTMPKPVGTNERASLEVSSPADPHEVLKFAVEKVRK